MEASSSPQTQKGKIRKSTQLKKWFVAKICEYSRGRKLIHQLSGNVGVEVIDAVQSLVLKHSGREAADDLVLQLYKVICKAGVLISEKEITDEMMRPCKHPNIILMHCLVEQLEEPVMLREAAVLFELLEESYRPILALLSRFEGSAQERLEKLKTFILSSDIVAFFLSSEEAAGEREVILRNMRAVMLPYEAEVVQVTRVVKLHLQSRKQALDRLLTQPNLVDFLRNAATFPVLCNWFAKNRDVEAIHWLYFYKSAREYSTMSSRSLMDQRATQIQRKHLLQAPAAGGGGAGVCKCPVKLPTDVHLRLVEKIDMDEFTHGLFTEAIAHTVSVLTDDFAVMVSEVHHFDFLREELATVENKLRALSRQQRLHPNGKGGDLITTTQSLLLPDHLLGLVYDSDSDGDDNDATNRRGGPPGAKARGQRGGDSNSNPNESPSDCDGRMSFWN